MVWRHIPHLVGHQITADSLLGDIHGGDQRLQGLGVLGTGQLQQPEEANGKKLRVQELALFGALGNGGQRLLQVTAFCCWLQV